jgi:hypothetical protein
VIFKNFKIADNGIAGVEFAIIEGVRDGYAILEDAIIVGNTDLNDRDDIIKNSNTHGVIGPKTDLFTIRNAKFYNFDFRNSAALGTCSHCFHPSASDRGGRMYTVSGLEFENVPKKIRYQIPNREIIHDLDGSLTGLGAGSYAAAFWPHMNATSECTDAEYDQYDGLICDNTIDVRSMVFFDPAPAAMRMQYIKVALWDEDIETALKANETDLFDFEQDVDHYYFSRLMQREPGIDVSNSWAVPYVTGHKYRFHWGEAIDFESITQRYSPYALETDLNTHLMTNFTDVRASINITDTAGNLIANETYLLTEDELETGYNVIYN